MTEPGGEHALYTSLAAWWPLISPPEEYVGEAAFAASLLRTTALPVRRVLELGCGGGHNAVHLSASFEMTLVDLSADMLAMSRLLNPECEHVQGDMRTLRLGQTFDAVFVHDAIDYMVRPEDLRQAVDTAYAHCKEGALALFVPDYTRESFRPGTEHGGSDASDGRGARYLEWTWDPDPSDTWVQSEYAFLLRDVDGLVRTVSDTHRIGVFSQQHWLETLHAAGFEAAVLPEATDDERPPRSFFVGRRPSA